jgi:hypothetical protein
VVATKNVPVATKNDIFPTEKYPLTKKMKLPDHKPCKGFTITARLNEKLSIPEKNRGFILRIWKKD